MRALLLWLLPGLIYAQTTVTAATNIHGEMVTVTLNDTIKTARYSNCINLTPYIYTWTVNNVAHVSVNMDSSAWTLNNLSTSALALCVTQTIL